MPDQDNKPSKEEVDAINEQTAKEWEGDFKEEDLKIPYKQEEEKVEEEKTAEKTEVVEEDEEYEPPAPIVTTEDPGEYVPADYSFEIQIDGKTVKVTSTEQADQLADDNADKLDAKTLGRLIREGVKIDSKLEKDKAEWENKKAQYDAEKALEDQRQEQVTSIASEFDYLVDKGLLPKVPKEYQDEDWNDPEIAKQPGVKEHKEILNYLVKENKARAKAKVKPLTSVIDAYNAWKLDNNSQQAVQAQKEEGEKRKQAGARVAGTTNTAQDYVSPKGIAVGDPSKLNSTSAIWEN